AVPGGGIALERARVLVQRAAVLAQRSGRHGSIDRSYHAGHEVGPTRHVRHRGAQHILLSVSRARERDHKEPEQSEDERISFIHPFPSFFPRGPEGPRPACAARKRYRCHGTGFIICPEKTELFTS